MASVKTTVFRPLNGTLDLRASPDDMAEGRVRWRQNIAMRDNRRVSRRSGFKKLFSDSPYHNEDLHDQLLRLQSYYQPLDPVPDGAEDVDSYPSASCGSIALRTQGREPITTLFEAISTSTRKMLFAATTSRIYLYSPLAKNWTIIADGLGDGSSKTYVAQLRDSVVFTNGVDKPFYHQIGQGFQGCDIRATRSIPDLETIGLTKANFVVEWKGLILFMNVVMDGVRSASRVIWSDYNKPQSFAPADGSLAGFQDLDYNEEILFAAPIGDQLIIYTTRSIWQASVTGNGEQPLAFFRSYHSTEGDKCLAFRNAITSTGASHIYASHEAIYLYSTLLPEPERIEWIHSSDSLFYGDRNEALCDAPIMAYWPEQAEVYFSFPRAGSSINNRTVVWNITPIDQGADVLDHGFTSFGLFTPDSRVTFGQFLVSYGICTAAQIQSELTKTPCLPDLGTPNCTPDSIWNEPESFGNPMSLSSLCSCLDGLLVSQLCSTCRETPIFIGASATDYCLKEFDETIYHREICINPTAVGSEGDCYTSATGQYANTGYISRIRLGPNDFSRPDIEKILTHLRIEAYPNDGNSGAYLHLKTGAARSAYDANKENTQTCAPIWEAHTPIEFKCLNSLTGNQAIAQNLRPDEVFDWAIYERDNFLYIDIMIADANGNAVTGGGGDLSHIEISLKATSSCK